MNKLTTPANDSPLSVRPRLYLLLACAACFAPLSIDLLIPALPQLSQQLGSSASKTQIAIFSFIAGYGIAPFFWGRLSDLYGRRPLLLLGLASYTVSSILCSLIDNFLALAAARFIQGFSAAAGIVISRALLRDVYGPRGATKAISTLYLFVAALPILIPAAGGALASRVDWPFLFLIMGAVGALSFAFAVLILPETAPARVRPAAAPLTRRIGSWEILSHPAFLANALTNMLAMTATVLFISNFAYFGEQVYGFNPQHNGFILATYNIAIAAGITLVRLLVPRLGVVHSLLVGTVSLSTGWLIVCILNNGSVATASSLLWPLLLASFGHGIIMALSPGQALVPFTHAAGTASAWYGCIQSVGAALISYLLAGFVSSSPAVLSHSIFICALLSALCAIPILREQSRQQ